MSTWTHVAGVIRYDGYALDPEWAVKHREELAKLLGKTVSFNDAAQDWDECEVPQGSEGSIQWEFIDRVEYKHEDFPGGGSMTRTGPHLGTVIIEGDLRDFGPDDWQEIRDWWDKITQPYESNVRPWSVRGGVLEMTTGYADQYEILRASRYES